MDVVADISQLRDRVTSWRTRTAGANNANSESIVLVPTMGNLHAGHLRLVELAKTKGNRVVVSIFVNPLQFSAGEDFANYPRTQEEDQRQLKGLGVDLLFAPSPELIYPAGEKLSTCVAVPKLGDILCGKHRPGHFVGVATIVAKLFNLIQPDTAIFGKKDFQQLLVIRRMAKDLGFPVDILGMDTVREADGLAMSSRNRYLSPEKRAKAAGLYAMLGTLSAGISSGDRNYRDLQKQGIARLTADGFEVDYMEILNAETLLAPDPGTQHLVILAAAHLGAARLIDNIEISI